MSSRSASSSPQTGCSRRVVANLNGDRFVSDPRTPLREGDSRPDPVRRRGRLGAMKEPVPFGYHGCYLRIDVSCGTRRSRAASGSGAAAVPRRQWARRLAAARGRRSERRSAGARCAAGVRVQSAGRQPADHVREVCGRQQEPADEPDQRFTRQQRLCHCRQALRLRRHRDRRAGGGALGVDHRRWTRSASKRPRTFAAPRVRRPKRR